MVGGMVVGWLWKKQECVALSAMEAEFVAASHTAAEMMGIMEVLKGIVVPILPGSIYMSTIKQQSLRSRARTRQVERSTSTCDTALSRIWRIRSYSRCNTANPRVYVRKS